MLRVCSVAIVLVIGCWSIGEAAVLCTAKSGEGTIRIREACRKNEIQLDPVALGLKGPGAVVKDSNGTLVGVVLDQGNQFFSDGLIMANILMKVAEDVIEIRVFSTGFQQDTIAAFYENADCSGQTFLGVHVVPPLAARALLVGSTLHYGGAPASQVTLFSSGIIEEANTNIGDAGCKGRYGLQRFFVPPNICCETISGGQVINVSPMRTFDVSIFVPPFHVELQP
jgi:hypothetical protein